MQTTSVRAPFNVELPTLRDAFGPRSPDLCLDVTGDPYGARMTMTEDRPATKPKTATNGDSAPQTLADQVVLSGAAFATQGFNNGRRLVVGLLDAVDISVLGLLDGADHLVRSNIAADLATRAVTVTRNAWTSAINGVKESLVTA